MTGVYGSSTPWLIKDPEKSKYEGIFDSLGPVGGKLPGDKVYARQLCYCDTSIFCVE